jgi:hypothetical protein
MENEKPKTNIKHLFTNPKNGKYLKIVARKYVNLYLSNFEINNV